jgi:hypothetical protein
MLFTNGISPIPAGESVSEILPLVVLGLAKLSVHGPRRFAGLLFAVGVQVVVQIPRSPLKKFGVTALVMGTIDRKMGAPVVRFVVTASPTVPEKPFGVTLVAPYLAARKA